MTARQVIEAAKAQGILIATAESCTGGLVAGALTDIPGSSEVLDRGFITYSNDAKTGMLGVPDILIDTHGAVSEEVAAAMAACALIRSRAGLTVAVTGIAGPGGSDFKPEGRVCFGLARTGANPQTETVDFGAIGRAAVRRASVDHALALLLDALDRTH